MSSARQTISRKDAIERIARHEFEQLGVLEREDILQDFWTIREDDPDYVMLGDELKAELRDASGPEHPERAHYDALILVALRYAYVGVVNAYLERKLQQLGQTNTQVEGLVEPLHACPCCGYCTLHLRGEYDVCMVCFWEDDGTHDPARSSSVNAGMTLQEARQRFATVDAIEDGPRPGMPGRDRRRYVFGDADTAERKVRIELSDGALDTLRQRSNT